MKFKKYQSYIFSLFTKYFLLVSIIFFCVVVIVNIFEEIKFSEKYQAEVYYSIYLSLLNAPSLMFEIFPFIFLISVKIFYINLVDRNELSILNTNGISNYNIIGLLTIITIILGLILVLLFYSFSSNLKSKYLDIKNRFSNKTHFIFQL